MEGDAGCRLGTEAVKHSGECDGFADMFKAAEPGYAAFDAHAETSVGHGAVLAQVQVPVEGFFWQIVLFYALQE